MAQTEYEAVLNNVSGLDEKVNNLTSDIAEQAVFKEFMLTALAEFSLLFRKQLNRSTSFQDYFSSVVGGIS